MWVRQEGSVLALDLRELEYLRDLLLDERTGDVWVAGWTGIARLRESKGAWTREYWRGSPGATARPKAGR